MDNELKIYIQFLNGRAINNPIYGKERDEVVKYRKRILDVIKVSKAKVTGSSIMTSLSDIRERLQILVGEITSGNTHKTLKSELAEIVHYLYKKKILNKQNYSKLMNLTR